VFDLKKKEKNRKRNKARKEKANNSKDFYWPPKREKLSNSHQKMPS
jgi:hypothetical protein